MLKYGKNINFNPEKLNKFNVDHQTSELISNGSLVLDIGCATGFLGEYLFKKKECVVDGIELGLSEAKVAEKKLRKVYVGDAEDRELINSIKNKYDIVNASAIIEHLKNPWEALRLWRGLIKKNGTLVISTSNIAHFSMRINLLRGRFNYEDYGILDNTHLRFFTAKTFKKLVSDTGYKIEYFGIDAEGGGFPRLSLIGSRFFPNLFAYQMVIRATP